MACKRLGTSLEVEDHDYQSNAYYRAKRMRLVEHDAKEATIKKIQNIIKNQFGKSVSDKEMEIEIISDRLYQARNFLDKLRAYVASQIYGSSDKISFEKGQETAQPVHPAVKKLFFGKKPKQMSTYESEELPSNSGSNNLPIINSPGKNVMDDCSLLPKNCMNTVTANSTCIKEKLEQKELSSLSSNDDCPEGVRAARFKICKKIIIGNVSRFITSDKREGNDHFTHKWMVYVRGPKEEPSIDHVVKKVWFLLHPSYRPNDFIEVSRPPFHLTRRGWGEFPVRVQIHFHDARNKRIDVVHMLKLDRTYTGLQTLGSETVVTSYLYKPDTLLRFDTSSPQLSLRTNSSDEEDSSDETDICTVTAHDEDCDTRNKTIDESAVNGSNNIQIKQEPLENNCDAIPSTVDFATIPKVKTEPVLDYSDANCNAKDNTCSGSSILRQNNDKFSNSLTSKSSLLTLSQSKVVSSSIVNSKVAPKTVNKTILAQHVPTESASSASILVSQGSRQSVGAVSLLRNNRLVVAPKTAQQETPHIINKSDGSSLLVVVPSTSTIPVVAGPKSDASKDGIKNSMLCMKSSLSSVLVIPPAIRNNSPSAPRLVTVSSPRTVQTSLKNVHETRLNQVVLNTQQTSLANKAIQIGQTIPNSAVLARMKRVEKAGNVFLVPQSTLLRTKVGIDGNSLVGKIGAVGLQASNNITHNSSASQQISTTQEMQPTYIFQIVPSNSSNTTQTQLVQLTEQSSVIKPKQYTTSEAKSILTNQINTSVVNNDHNSTNSEEDVKTVQSNNVNIENCKTIEEILKLLIRKFPLIVENADKSVHPYSAASAVVFLSWTIGKQRAAEWQRARTVRLALLDAFSKSDRWGERKVWNTKEVLLWCRRYGYTPLKRVAEETNILEEGIRTENVNTFSDCKDLWNKLEHITPPAVENNEEENEVVDIEAIDEIPGGMKQETVQSKESRLRYHLPISEGAEFVQEEACKIGVKFQSEEIQPGIMMSVAEEMLFQVTKLFAENLIRGSVGCNFDRVKNKRYSSTVMLDDVFRCIVTQPEFNFLSNQHLGKAILDNEKQDE